jgi:bacterioferritin
VQGKKEVIGRLNELLKNELTAINQYFLHARILDSWGYLSLGKKVYCESLGEMKHAQKIIDRILMLDGLPNLQALGALNIGENTPEILQSDLALESSARTLMIDTVKFFLEQGDHVSRNLVEGILQETEEHIDWLESQLKQILDMGVEIYLGHQLKKD